jgi:hypothetical protein
MSPQRGKETRLLAEALGILSGLGVGLPMPQREFLVELTVGILRAKSCLLSEVVRALLDEARPRRPRELHALYHRLDEDLGKYDLTRPYERAQALMFSQVDSSCLFIFDPSEVTKPYAKKMEGLSVVRDASAPKRIETDPKTGKRRKRVVLKPGYPIRMAVAMNSLGELIPLDLSLYSPRAENFLSSNDENLQALETILHRTNFQPIVVLDREFDQFALYRHFCLLRLRFIIRIKKNRKFFLPDEPRSKNQRTYFREEILENSTYLETKAVVQFTRHGVTRSLLCTFRAARVKLLSEDKKQQTFRDQGDLNALILVEIKLHKAKGIPRLYLLSSLRPITENELQEVGLNYLARWNIEEYVRFVKQHFGLEGFLVADLGRMKNLMRAVFVATTVLHQLTEIKTVVGNRNREHLVLRAAMVRPEKKAKDFYWYSYANGLANIVQWNQRLFDSLHKVIGHLNRKAA